MVCKWDADMFLSASADKRTTFIRYLHNCVDKKAWVFGAFPIQTIYIDREGVSYYAKDEVNGEVRVFPNSPFVYFKKGDLWEKLTSDLFIADYYSDDVCVYEIKDVADDEFSHWTGVRLKGRRKVREYRNYMRVKNDWHKSDAPDYFSAVEL
jgi:hypothetical protein